MNNEEDRCWSYYFKSFVLWGTAIAITLISITFFVFLGASLVLNEQWATVLEVDRML